MELNKAIQELSDMCDIVRCGDYYSLENDDIEAIDTVLQELDTRYSKGYQDGFQSVRYDKYVNDMYGEGESAVKYLIIEREGYIRGYAEAWKRAKEIKEENNEQI